jgi:hypothetical protein
MKLMDLLETPVLNPAEMPINMHPHRPFISVDTIDREYRIIAKEKTLTGEEYFVILRKHNDQAVIGIPGFRETDKKPGIEVMGTVAFKHSVQLSGKQTFNLNTNVLQVEGIRIGDKAKHQGWGFYLYLTLAKCGYVVISDNNQYIGGKELWKKIARNVINSNYKVYVIDSGAVRVDTAGRPVTYDGHNIDDAELWSINRSRRYTLFALRSEIGL